MGIVVLILIFSAVSLGYTAVYKSLEVLVNHQIFERFTTKNMSIVHAVLSTLVPLYESICFFVMRNHPFNPGMEPPTPPPFMQSPPPDTYYRGPVPPPEPPMGENNVDVFAAPVVQEDSVNAENIFAPQTENTGEPDEGKKEAPVNFILPESDNKEF